MSLPDEFTLERFRSFAGRVRLPLRPITLVYGANNSGKSALLRALAMLGASVESGQETAINLPERAFPGVRFTDLAWQGEAGNYSWRLGLRWGHAPVREVRLTLKGASDTEPFISQLEIQPPDAQGRWLARANADRILVEPGSGALLPFEGLVPAEPTATSLMELRRQLFTLRGRVRWLAGVRAPTARSFQPASPSDRLRFGDGTGAAALMVRDAELLAAVGRFYASLERPREIQLHETPVGHYLTLNPASQPRWRVHLNDTGEGMVQVLPVLIQAELAAREGGILAVEEPESHLHPDAQHRLAEHLCQLAARPEGPRFILETHSRVFLLGVQRAVALDLLPADGVRVVWVDQAESGHSTVTSIPLHPDGRLGDGWPRSALAEDLRLAREVTRLGREAREQG